MTWGVPAALRVPWNDAVLAYLGREAPSAHSDVASELSLAAAGIPGARAYCPDPARYAWVLLYTPEGRVFGLAAGMDLVAFRLGPHEAVAALREGAERAERIGPGWIGFRAFVAAEPTAETRARLARWCRAAFDGALGAGPA